MKHKYHVVGNEQTKYAVVDNLGGIVYDLLDSRKEAVAIKNVLNKGIGPEWDAVSAALAKKEE